METRKQYEERLITEMLEILRQKTGTECLSNILMYAAEYLQGRFLHVTSAVDMEEASILEQYSNLLSLRIQEVR